MAKEKEQCTLCQACASGRCCWCVTFVGGACHCIWHVLMTCIHGNVQHMSCTCTWHVLLVHVTCIASAFDMCCWHAFIGSIRMANPLSPIPPCHLWKRKQESQDVIANILWRSMPSLVYIRKYINLKQRLLAAVIFFGQTSCQPFSITGQKLGRWTKLGRTWSAKAKYAI